MLLQGHQIKLEHKEDIMTIAERLEQRGKEAGIQIGLEKAASNMLLKNLDEKIIAESTGLSLEEIKRLNQIND